MARPTPRPTPTATRTLQPLGRYCPLCGETMWAAYHNYRTITTLDDVVQLTLQIRRCLNRLCPQFRRPYRPEEEGRLALPKHEFGLCRKVGFWRQNPKIGSRKINYLRVSPFLFSVICDRARLRAAVMRAHRMATASVSTTPRLGQ